MGQEKAWLPPDATPHTSPGQVGLSPSAVPEPAGWWARVGATILDGLIVLFAALAVGLVGAVAGGGDVFSTAFDVGYLVVFVFYAPLMLAFHGGRTWGKQACSIRVMNRDGSPIGFGRALLREVPVKSILGIVPLIDSLWPLWQKEKRALHDLAVRTRVVDDD